MSKKGRYVWVPAAMENDMDGIGIYCKHKKHRDGPIVVKRRSGQLVYVDCPDRDILVQRERYYNHDPLAVKAWKMEDYDEYVHLDVNNAKVMQDLPFEYSMLNASSVTGSGYRKFAGDRGTTHTKLMMDSGGYQLYSGIQEFLKPEDIIASHNKHGDVGMILDIPCPMDMDAGFMKRLTRIQNANTKVMLKNKREDFELINVIHGITPKDYKMYMKEVDVPAIDRMSFGFTRRQDNLLRGVRKVADLLTMPGRKFKHYHVLGVGDIIKTIPLMYLAKSGVVPLITSDSSTPTRNASSALYLHYPVVRSALEKLDVGRKHTRPSRYSLLPCNCAVCGIVKYSDALALTPGSLMSRALIFHNLLEYRKYLMSINQMVRDTESVEEFMREIKWSVSKEKHNLLLTGIRMVETALQDGMKAVDEKFSYQLHQRESAESGLFQGTSSSSAKEGKRLAHLKKVVNAYEKYHGL